MQRIHFSGLHIDTGRGKWYRVVRVFRVGKVTIPTCKTVRNTCQSGGKGSHVASPGTLYRPGRSGTPNDHTYYGSPDDHHLGWKSGSHHDSRHRHARQAGQRYVLNPLRCVYLYFCMPCRLWWHGVCFLNEAVELRARSVGEHMVFLFAFVTTHVAKLSDPSKRFQCRQINIYVKVIVTKPYSSHERNFI